MQICFILSKMVPPLFKEMQIKCQYKCSVFCLFPILLLLFFTLQCCASSHIMFPSQAVFSLSTDHHLLMSFLSHQFMPSLLLHTTILSAMRLLFQASSCSPWHVPITVEMKNCNSYKNYSQLLQLLQPHQSTVSL